jgi:hypothetical protein
MDFPMGQAAIFIGVSGSILAGIEKAAGSGSFISFIFTNVHEPRQKFLRAYSNRLISEQFAGVGSVL